MKIYLRIAEHPEGRESDYKADASTTPKSTPLSVGDRFNKRYLPTVAFAVEFNIPDKKFREAEQVIAEVSIPEDQVEIAAEVVPVT